MKNLVAIPLLAVVLSCGAAATQQAATQADLKGSPQVPAAQGRVEAKEGKNGNTEVDVRVEHLAEPSKVVPDAKTYVVWAKPKSGAPPQNLGAIMPDKDLSAELQTITPLKSFDILVTPEKTPEAMKPTHAPVLSTTIKPANSNTNGNGINVNSNPNGTTNSNPNGSSNTNGNPNGSSNTNSNPNGTTNSNPNGNSGQ